MAKTISVVNDDGSIDVSVPTASDLSGFQYCFVKKNSSGKIVAADTANEQTLGVLQNAPDGSTKETEAIVRVQGITKLKTGAGVTVLEFLKTVVTAATAAPIATDHDIYGAQALCDGDSGDLIQALITHGWAYHS